MIAKRYSTVALIAFIVVAVSGFGNAWVRISYLPDLWLTDYGRLVLLKAGLLVTLGCIGYLHRRRTLPAIIEKDNRRPLIRLAVVEVGVMAATIGVAAALGRTATPPPSAAAPTDIELALGYNLDGPPTLTALLSRLAVRLAARGRGDRRRGAVRDRRVPAPRGGGIPGRSAGPWPGSPAA